MKNAGITETSQCTMCDGRLRNAVFCSICGESSCSWACYLRHVAQHARLAGHPASYPGEPRQDDRPDSRAGREPAAAGRPGWDVDPNAGDRADYNPLERGECCRHE
jgi:hypothetical protein